MNSQSKQFHIKSSGLGILNYPYTLIRPVYEKTSFHRSVIDELPTTALREAYAHCRHITRHHAKTFYLSTRFLPNEKQRSIFAVYALCRYIDDLVDETNDLIVQKKVSFSELDRLLDEWRLKLDKAYITGEADNPILTAFADTLSKYHIPKSYPFELMEGVCMDLKKNRFETFDEVYEYSYKVASVVGLMTSEIFGYTDEKALSHAIDLGIAMQLTNILRDVGEDLGRNRIYIPQEDLKTFGLSEADLFNKVYDERFTAMMEFQVKRARHYYDSADEGIPMLSTDSRLPVYLARMNYSRILDRIEKIDYKVYDQRAFLSTSEKLALIPRAWLSALM